MNNHKKPITAFTKDIKKLRKHGHKPIAVTQMYCEETFVFETDQEAKSALLVFNESEQECHFGWWLGKDEFSKSVEYYEKQYTDTTVLIYWL